jgi:hypothetical protein
VKYWKAVCHKSNNFNIVLVGVQAAFAIIVTQARINDVMAAFPADKASTSAPTSSSAGVLLCPCCQILMHTPLGGNRVAHAHLDIVIKK